MAYSVQKSICIVLFTIHSIKRKPALKQCVPFILTDELSLPNTQKYDVNTLRLLILIWIRFVVLSRVGQRTPFGLVWSDDQCVWNANDVKRIREASWLSWPAVAKSMRTWNMLCIYQGEKQQRLSVVKLLESITDLVLFVTTSSDYKTCLAFRITWIARDKSDERDGKRFQGLCDGSDLCISMCLTRIKEKWSSLIRIRWSRGNISLYLSLCLWDVVLPMGNRVRSLFWITTGLSDRLNMGIQASESCLFLHLSPSCCSTVGRALENESCWTQRSRRMRSFFNTVPFPRSLRRMRVVIRSVKGERKEKRKEVRDVSHPKLEILLCAFSPL